jgi:shikimate kinase
MPAADRPIALIGMMGAGKSAVGRALAARLGCRFADTDVLIEAEAGRTIAAIFASEGEPAFRERERRLIDRLAGFRGHVLALGGGMFVGERNVTRIRAAALTVWVRASADTLLDRLGPAAGRERPLLDGPQPETRLGELLAARSPWYGRAHLIIETDGRDLDQVVALVVGELARRRDGAGGEEGGGGACG